MAMSVLVRSAVLRPATAVATGSSPRWLHSQDSLLTVPVEKDLPARARVVIAGSGLIGNSVAYHLVVQHGWKDVVVIDRGSVADGTSKYGSGVLGLFRPSHERSIVQYCIELYKSLQTQLGFDIGLNTCGAINLANSKDRMVSLQRRANRYKPTGLECHVLSPKEILELHPYLYVEDLQGGVWLPDEANVHPKKVSEALAYLAYRGGARFVGNCSLERVLTHTEHRLGPMSSSNIRVSGVQTSKGLIECEYFVNCAGIWARHIGELSEPHVKIPVCPAEHFFLTFKELPELRGKQLPNVRDYDNNIYFRTWRNSFLIGAFEKEARPWKLDNAEHWSHVTEDHWRHMASYISSAIKRMPILQQTEYDYLLNTPDAFTPDGRWILGEAPEIGNYYVCAGMNGNSLQGAGGVGKAVADWMALGRSPGNMLNFELQRFTNLHNNPRFLYERTFEVVGRHYQLMYPLVNEFKRGRKIRTSPLFSELEARGAVFGERMGWERPLYFNSYHSREDPPAQLPKGTLGKPEFFENIEDEYLVCREGVGIIDMSSFTKFHIQGEPSSVVNYLQMLCSNDVDIPVGCIVNTGMLNENGGYENDCMLVRQKKHRYFMVSPTQQQTRIHEWMTNHLPKDNSVNLQDVTSMYAVLSVAGPKSKDLMQQMTRSDMSMPPFTYKYVNMGYASGIMVLAVTQTGEAGFSLYVQSDHALHLYDSIMTAGYDFGIKNVGHLAMRFLRIEKFIPFWGEELTSVTTPIEVGRAFKVKYDKPHFIGKSSLVEQKTRGVTKKLVQFHLAEFNKDTDLWPSDGDAVYRNGEYVGALTNSAYGFTLHKMVCLGFIQHPETIKGNATVLDHKWMADKNATWAVHIAGRMVPATMHMHPPQITTMAPGGQGEKPAAAKKGHAPRVDVLRKVQ